jgi:hypothetical protein
MSVHIEEYKGYTIRIEHDNDPIPPSDWESAAMIVSHHRDFEMNTDLTTAKDFPHNEWWKFPLYLYSHSGVALSLDNTHYPFNDVWDSCQSGFVFVKRSEMKAPKKQSATQVARGYVDAWNAYLSGECLGYVIEDTDGEVVDSCWGFYDPMEYVLSEAKEAVCYITE